jgi:GT2 family glycosyltransferase/glycosyltransferase involved in cell wall biosynthesis
MNQAIKVLFASGSENLIPLAIDQMQRLFPELPLVVVSEFPVAGARWIPYPVARGLRENLALFRWHFRDQRIQLSAVILQPRMPYRQMRLVAFLLAPRKFLAFNENLGHFMLRPQSLATIVRHVLWRTRNFLAWQLSPDGTGYALLRGLVHPGAFRQLFSTVSAEAAGVILTALKAILPPQPRVSRPTELRPRGISVVIPSRNGKDLLAALLPETIRQISQMDGEVVVIDNGSDDGTVDFLSQAYPEVRIDSHSQPLSFACAANLGIRKSRFSHVCLLNNDMVIEEGFFEALLAAFDKVPGLFCATAQIFFPKDARREETGKAVLPALSERKPSDFPLRCDRPFPGEDLSYVLYGSGGCSLFDAAKLRELGGLDEVYEPAYVEDLDLGFRAWQHGWPSVFVAGAHTVHKHRATTTRYYSPEFLDRLLELNYLRFLARTIADPRVFWRQWRDALGRLTLLSAAKTPAPGAAAALGQAWRAVFWLTRRPRSRFDDSHILSLGSGAVSVVPGRPRRHRKMVLVATPYLPFPLAHGGAVRMFNLMRRAAQDFDQVLVSFTGEPGEVPSELLEICCEVMLVKRLGTHLLPTTSRPEVVEEFDSPAFHAALRQTVRKWNPDIAQLEFTQMAQYAPDCSPAKTILVEHDVTLDLYRQLLAQGDDWEGRRQLARWTSFETSAWRQVDRVVTMSEKDREMIVATGSSPTRIVCLPNGVDLERFRPTGGRAEPRRLLFIGSFAHLPNLLAVEFFLRDVWPQLRGHGATLHIIAGARAQYYVDRYRNRVRIDLAQPGVEVEDFVADVRPAYERAAVVVAPLPASAGTNIKIMEAMAMGKAIVSTPAGINGLDLYSGKEVIVASTGAAMSQAILELFEIPMRRHSLERKARRTAESRFDWDAIARQQKFLYEEVAGATGERRDASRLRFGSGRYRVASQARKRPSGVTSSQ